MYFERTPILLVIAFIAAGNLGCQSARPIASSGWLRSPTADSAHASEALEESVPSDPVRQRIGLIQARAAIHESDNNTAEAVRSYESILKADPGHVVALHRLAILHSQLGDHSKAEAYFLKALELAEQTPQLHNDYGYYCYLLGNTDLAMHHYCRAVALDPRFFEAHNNLGMAYGKLGRFDEAEREFLLAGCSRAEVLNNLAFARLMESDFAGATATYELALQENPGQANARPAIASLNKSSRTDDSLVPVTYTASDASSDSLVGRNTGVPE